MDSPPDQPPPTAAHRKAAFTSGFASARDLLTFFAGLAIIGNEVYVSATAEPSIIAVGVVMIGLPVAFGADERKRKGGGEG